MKKFLSLLLALVMAMSLVACNDPHEDGRDAPPDVQVVSPGGYAPAQGDPNYGLLPDEDEPQLPEDDDGIQSAESLQKVAKDSAVGAVVGAMATKHVSGAMVGAVKGAFDGASKLVGTFHDRVKHQSEPDLPESAYLPSVEDTDPITSPVLYDFITGSIGSHADMPEAEVYGVYLTDKDGLVYLDKYTDGHGGVILECVMADTDWDALQAALDADPVLILAQDGRFVFFDATTMTNLFHQYEPYPAE